MKLSTIGTGTETLLYGFSGILFIALGIGSVKALKRIHADWNDSHKSQQYLQQRVRAAVGNLLTAVGFLLSGTTGCYLSLLNGKALALGTVDLATNAAALNLAVPAALISVVLVAIGFFLVPSGAPSTITESPP